MGSWSGMSWARLWLDWTKNRDGKIPAINFYKINILTLYACKEMPSLSSWQCIWHTMLDTSFLPASGNPTHIFRGFFLNHSKEWTLYYPFCTFLRWRQKALSQHDMPNWNIGFQFNRSFQSTCESWENDNIGYFYYKGLKMRTRKTGCSSVQLQDFY